MTLPSLRNLRITRLNRPVWTASLALAALAALCIGSAGAQRPGQRDLLTNEDYQPRIQLIEGVQQAQDSTLDRLKQRSAQDRFDQIRQQQTASPSLEPLPLLEPAQSAPVPVVPPAPEQNKLPRLPDLEDLEEFDPFIESQKKLHSARPPVQPQRIASPVLSPAPVENKLPQLPDLDELEDSDPFAEPQPQLQFVNPQQNRLLPSPVPAPAPNLTAPALPGFQDPEEDDSYQEPSAPDVVRPLTDILPTYDYQFTVKDIYLQDSKDTDPNRVPQDVVLPENVYHERLSPDSLFAWEASNLYHNPLYFEDPALERYGHVHQCVQPLVSLTRLGVQVIGLPYQSVIDTPWTERYTLGWYRPGEPAPHLCYQVPLNAEAAFAETLAVTAGFLIIP